MILAHAGSMCMRRRWVSGKKERKKKSLVTVYMATLTCSQKARHEPCPPWHLKEWRSHTSERHWGQGLRRAFCANFLNRAKKREI